MPFHLQVLSHGEQIVVVVFSETVKKIKLMSTYLIRYCEHYPVTTHECYSITAEFPNRQPDWHSTGWYVCIISITGCWYVTLLPDITPPLSPACSVLSIADNQKIHSQTTISHFHDYGHNNLRQELPPPDAEPWKPFRTRLDFEVAELALSAALNKDQINTLISLLHRYGRDQENFTLSNHDEVCNMWESASDLRTKVCHGVHFYYFY